MRFFNKDSDITYSEFSKGRILYPDLKICAWVNVKRFTKRQQTTQLKEVEH